MTEHLIRHTAGLCSKSVAIWRLNAQDQSDAVPDLETRQFLQKEISWVIRELLRLAERSRLRSWKIRISN